MGTLHYFLVCSQSFVSTVSLYFTALTKINADAFCCPCIGICYGFQVMRYHESPNTPFTVIYTRFVKGWYLRILLLILSIKILFF